MTFQAWKMVFFEFHDFPWSGGTLYSLPCVHRSVFPWLSRGKAQSPAGFPKKNLWGLLERDWDWYEWNWDGKWLRFLNTDIYSNAPDMKPTSVSASGSSTVSQIFVHISVYSWTVLSYYLVKSTKQQKAQGRSRKRPWKVTDVCRMVDRREYSPAV